MKTFEELCALTQYELKSYCKKFLKSNGYDIVDGDGYLYGKPREKVDSIPVMLIAHLDTVHKDRIKTVNKVQVRDDDMNIDTKISSPEGIGGDDRCGVWIILNIIKKKNPHVLFCEDEEIGCVGSAKFSRTELCKRIDIKYMIQLDRRGSKDLVFYSCDNKEFTNWLEEKTGYKTASGSCSDISKLMPVMKTAGVNFSCGYYHEHTKDEYVMENEMKHTMETVDKLLEEDIPKKFEYVAKTYSYNQFGRYFGANNYFGNVYNTNNYNSNRYYDRDGYEYDDDLYSYQKKSMNIGYNTHRKEVSDTKVTLRVYLDDEYMEMVGLDEIEMTGNTKPECWMNLFMEYCDLAFVNIIDYEYE